MEEVKRGPGRPKASSQIVATEMEKAEEQFEKFDNAVQTLTLDRMNMAPLLEEEQQTKLSQKQLDRAPGIYLKPARTYPSKEKFNEKFRAEYNEKKEVVHFIAENKEAIGGQMDISTKPFPGMPIEEWVVPNNKPVWGPRYLAERIKGCTYHQLVMSEEKGYRGSEGAADFYGVPFVENVKQRLDAYPVSTKRSIFMGANG